MQTFFPEVKVPTIEAIARVRAEGNSLPSWYLHRGGRNRLVFCLLKHEFIVLSFNTTWQIVICYYSADSLFIAHSHDPCIGIFDRYFCPVQRMFWKYWKKRQIYSSNELAIMQLGIVLPTGRRPIYVKYPFT